MTRCKATTCSGKRCKKTADEYGFCGIHRTVECCLCNEVCDIRIRKTLKHCGHSFCKMCIARDFYDFQWFDDFSTEHPIKCPECDLDLCDDDWTFVTDFLCQSKLLQRKIVCDTYLCPVVYNELYNHVVLGKEYDIKEIDTITRYWNKGKSYRTRESFNNKDADIVYFNKFTGLFNWHEAWIYNAEHTFYRFFYGTQETRNLFPALEKELIEYVFHPCRINLETLEFI